MAAKRGKRVGVRAEEVSMSAKDYVDSRVDGNTRELSTKIDGVNAKIDGAITGLNAKIDGAITGLNAKIDGAITGLNAKIDGAVAGLNGKMDGLRAEFAGLGTKMDAVLQIISPMFDALRHLQGDVDVLKDLLTPKGPIGFRKAGPE